ncbi:MAG: SPOR domain-containing protein [Devosiaceae bacterium]
MVKDPHSDSPLQAMDLSTDLGRSNNGYQELDPLEELARIMNDTNTPKPSDETENSGNDLTAQPDPLDLGLGDQGLAELFGDRGTPDATADPFAELADDLDLQLDPQADLQSDPQPDNLFSDLDFNTLESVEPAAVQTAELPAFDALDSTQPPALISDHLTPREATEPADYSRVEDDDLLAAMDAIALDEPAQAGAYSAPPPLSAAPRSFASPEQSSAPDFSFDAAPQEQSTFGGEDQNPASGFQDFDDAGEDEGRAGPGKMIVLALAAVAVLGLGGVFAFGLLSGGGADADGPQVIAAQEGDDKVEPAPTEDEQSRPGDAAFSALDASDTGTQATPRVVLQRPSGDGLPLRSGEPLPSADIAPAPPGSTASRAVRTVTVRADGTVVESTAAPTPAANEVQAEAADARPVEVVSITPGNDAVSNQPSQEVATALREAVQGVVDSAAPAPLAPTSGATPPAPIARPAATPVQTQPVQVQPVQTQPVQAQPAQTANRVQPIQLAAPAAAPAQAVAPAAAPLATPAATPASVPSGEFIVQLASLRSEAEARDTFTRLQNRFGSILSGFGPNIQRADLGDRGIYHRVRVGPMERSAADSLCSRYQSAGGDCFVQRQ